MNRVASMSLFLDRRMRRIFLLGLMSGFPWVLIGSSLSLWLSEDEWLPLGADRQLLKLVAERRWLVPICGWLGWINLCCLCGEFSMGPSG